jgi:hypothetical protein
MKLHSNLARLSLSAVLSLSASACTSAVDDTVGTDESQLTVSRSGALKPGIGASACKSDTCVSGPTSDCTSFDDDCKQESGCGVNIAGNPIAQVHSCVTIPPPPASESQVGGLTAVAFDDIPLPARTELDRLTTSRGPVPLQCGGKYVNGPTVWWAYGCSFGGTLCYVQQAQDGSVEGHCDPCSGRACTPWN